MIGLFRTLPCARPRVQKKLSLGKLGPCYAIATSLCVSIFFRLRRLGRSVGFDTDEPVLPLVFRSEGAGSEPLNGALPLLGECGCGVTVESDEGRFQRVAFIAINLLQDAAVAVPRYRNIYARCR